MNTRHWVEAFVNHDTEGFRLVCEHPTDCGQTAPQDRASGCGIITQWDTNSGKIFPVPVGQELPFGRVEVRCTWVQGEDGLDLRLVPAELPAAVTADPDTPCEHLHFDAAVSVNRLANVEGGPITGYHTEIRVWCAGCREPFRWIGVPAGLLPTQPCVNPDETVLNAPMRPASSDPDFGLGIPGYAIREPS